MKQLFSVFGKWTCKAAILEGSVEHQISFLPGDIFKIWGMGSANQAKSRYLIRRNFQDYGRRTEV